MLTLLHTAAKKSSPGTKEIAFRQVVENLSTTDSATLDFSNKYLKIFLQEASKMTARTYDKHYLLAWHVVLRFVWKKKEVFKLASNKVTPSILIGHLATHLDIKYLPSGVLVNVLGKLGKMHRDEVDTWMKSQESEESEKCLTKWLTDLQSQ